ncbi:MAG TPA: peptidoglycan recognition family protein [Candidatus Paceibacterota bacterium]
MALWTDLAVYRGPTPNNSGRRYTTRGLVLHIAEGSYEGTCLWALNPNAQVSYHFVIGENGQIAQIVDTDLVAWTQAAGNTEWMSVEFEGHTGRSLTPAMLESAAKLFARIHTIYGVPLQVSNSPYTNGLGHHAMGGTEWGGHFQCPGQPIIDQKPAIVKRAIEIVGGASTSVLNDEGIEKLMFLVQLKGNPAVFLSDGVNAKWIRNPGTLADTKALAAEDTMNLGNNCNVRVVTNRDLIGHIVGLVPAGFTADPA